jgi:hypothetical protein
MFTSSCRAAESMRGGSGESCGVIGERDLVGYDPAAGTVTFRYLDARTQQPAYRTLPIAGFLWRALSRAAERLSPSA